MLILFLLLVFISGLIFVGVVGLAFKRVGFSPQLTVFILVTTFVGSYINIPLFRVKTIFPVLKEEYVSFLNIVFRTPKLEYEEFSTIVALNLGGALIPILVSIYLLWKMSSIIPYAIIGIIIVALITYIVVRPVKGLGIVAPAFIPPLAAAVVAYLLPSGAPSVIAYTAGVLGTLIGADIFNLNKIPSLGAKVVSIGGAGTFDGIFLSGIISVLLV